MCTCLGLLVALFATRCILFFFTTVGRLRLPGFSRDSREHGRLKSTWPTSLSVTRTIYKDKYDKALEVYKSVLETKIRVCGQDSLDVAKTRENMAMIYYAQVHYDQALQVYKSVPQTMIRVCGHDSLDVAKSYNFIGLIYNSLGQSEEALEYYQKDLEHYSPPGQTAPPPRDAAKMSPRISIGPEPVLAAHAPSPPAAGSHARLEKTQLPITEQNFLFTA